MKRIIFLLMVLAVFRLNGQTLTQVGYYSVNGIMAMDTKPGLAVLGNGQLIDITDPTSPILVGNVGFPGFCTSVTVDGNRAYLGTGMLTKLMIVDITNPTIPLQIGSKLISSSGAGIFGIAKRGNVLYVAASGYGIYSIDITNEALPVLLDSIPASSTGQARDIVVDGNLAYVADVDGFEVVDISDPTDMNIIATIGSGYFAIDVDTTMGQVYLGKTGGGVDVFTVWNPWSPSPAFGIPGTSSTWDVKVKNNHVFISKDDGSMSVYSIFGSAGTLVGTFPNTGNGQSFACAPQDSLVLVSGLINGVAVVKCSTSIWVAGISNLQTDPEAVTLSPNPMTDASIIRISNRAKLQNAELNIMDVTGRVIRTISGISSNEIAVTREHLPSGVYFFQLTDANESVKGKFVVQ